MAQQGYRPLPLERGKPVKQRTADTFGFWKGRLPFNPASNAQFGEGGAGTFSDGKLYSGVKESKRHGRWVLEELVESGANPEILVLNKPHIGTFKLVGVGAAAHHRSRREGFEHHVTGVELSPGIRQLKALILASGERIETDAAVFAVPHSSDPFALLHGQGVAMEPKPFGWASTSIPNP